MPPCIGSKIFMIQQWKLITAPLYPKIYENASLLIEGVLGKKAALILKWLLPVC